MYLWRYIKISGIKILLRGMFCLFIIPVLTGCIKVGPDYVSPVTKVPDAWRNKITNEVTGKEPSELILIKWWTTLDDPVLNEIIEKAVANNKDIGAAKARIREERARRNISRAGFFPTIDTSGSFSRSSGSRETGSGKETDFYSAGFDAVWELDIFGGNLRSLEAASAELEASEENLCDILVSLLAEVALNYIEVRTYQARIVVAEKNLAIQEQAHQIAWLRYGAGLSGEIAVQQAKYNLENTRAQIPLLRISLEEAKNRISVLLGENPGSVHGLLNDQRSVPVSPPAIVIGVPADVLRRRPDIRRAERKLAAQTARVGAASADQYPKLSLTGSIGFESLSIDKLLLSGSRNYAFGPRISWPLFRAGSIRSNIEVHSAVQEQMLNQYESAVLNALDEVENRLMSYMENQNRRQALNDAKTAAGLAADLAVSQYRSGLTDFTSVLDAQRSLLSFEDNFIQCESGIVSDLVRLYKALGGGWTSMSDDYKESGS
jgi:NodT family efflux transporter outer membrane factor (OMF) lipoprotein